MNAIDEVAQAANTGAGSTTDIANQVVVISEKSNSSLELVNKTQDGVNNLKI